MNSSADQKVSRDKWEELHEEACKRNEEFYIDPETGYQVFTRLKHLSRGQCCDSGCRHCPYNNPE